MMERFTTKKFDGRKPSIHVEKDDGSPSDAFMPGGSPSAIVEVLRHPDEDRDWVHVKRQKVKSRPEFVIGWMRRGHLLAPLDLPAVAPVSVAEFVKACARQELGASTGGDPAHAVLADYLIALALIESGEQFDRQTQGSDGIGPYQFGAKVWDTLATAEGLTNQDRFVGANQTRIAAAIARRDWAAYSALARPGGATAPDGPFVPTFLNLFHAWLIGVPAAHEVDRVNAQGDPGSPIGPILEKHHPGASNALMAARATFLQDAGNDGRVAGFMRRTTQTLEEALSRAGTLLATHFPEFALPAMSTTAPWMAIAEREQQFWDVNGLVETSPIGAERVRAYFADTDYTGPKDDPWCGAFVAHCLRQSGNTRAASSVIAGAARAANWKTWGDFELRGGAAAPPRGVLVVLGPSGDTGPSGHVAFFTGTTAGTNRVFLLGGNQSHRVKVSDFPISRIVAVRWLDVDQDDETVPTPVGGVAGVIPDEVLTMARTLYGEARGEPPEGIKAVASVIMNRVLSPRYPNTIGGVCLQDRQFSCWNRNDPNRPKIVNLQPDADPEIIECMNIAQAAASGTLPDQTGGALHYHATSIARPTWVLESPSATKVGPIGSHVFYVGIK